MWEKLKRYQALLVIAVVFGVSLFKVVTYRAAQEPPGVIILRIGHWQLESGVRDGFIELAKEYQKLHPNVRVVQDAIPESVYGQWSTTQFIGGTAPDMMEMGLGVPYQQVLAFYNRYCLPLTSLIDKPNPYNAGTELADTPLRMTYKDAMKTGYINELQEYMTIPLAQFATRIFYNKDLYRRLTGRDEPPANYREFLEVCAKIKACKDGLGRPYTPIVGSRYNFNIWDTGMADVLTYRLMEKADFNRDGYVGNDEMYVAIKTGRLSFNSFPISAKFALIRAICDNCQPGFTGLTRDEGVFMFAQERAVFITTGTWDTRSIQAQAEGHFELGIMDFPVPTKEDPEFGSVALGRRYENPGSSFAFAVTRNSKHPEIAIDFLLFLASKQNNTRLCQIIGWIPAIIDTPVDDLLKNFKPNLEGIYGNFNPNLGGETWIRWLQLYSKFQVGQLTYKELVEQFEPFYKEKGVRDFNEQRRDWRRGIVVNETLLTGIKSQAMFAASPDEAATYWIKYRTLTRDRQIFPEISFTWQKGLVEGVFQPEPTGPYEYSPAALERIRASLSKGGRQP